MSSVSEPRLRVDDFDYDLPERAIAQIPAEPRDASRLLVLDRATGRIEHARFRDVGRWLSPGDLLVVNDSRVLPARLVGMRASGGAAEILVLRPLDDRLRWEALVRPSRRLPAGSVVTLRSGDRVEVGERLADDTRAVRFERDPHEVMAAAGEMPLPPYIHDRSSATGPIPDGLRATTRIGRCSDGRPALHRRAARVPRRTRASHVRRVTLHVGLDTFRPLEGEFIDEHRIHREWYEVPAATRQALAEARRVVAVGTTAVRVLETAARTEAAEGWTDLYVTPPYRFKAVDALITNFHLPRSSLLLLVTAFVQAGMGDGDRPLRGARPAARRLPRGAAQRGIGSSASATRC